MVQRTRKEVVMKRSSKALLVCLLVFVAGCGGTLHDRYTCSKGTVYTGMSSDALRETMGAPHEVHQGRYTCKYSGKFFGSMPGDYTVEWAWHVEGGILVAYMDFGQVRKIGWIPKK